MTARPQTARRTDRPKQSFIKIDLWRHAQSHIGMSQSEMKPAGFFHAQNHPVRAAGREISEERRSDSSRFRLSGQYSRHPILTPRQQSEHPAAGAYMAFFQSAVGTLQTIVIALGAGLGVWGGINLLEGYGNDNRVTRSRQDKRSGAKHWKEGEMTA